MSGVKVVNELRLVALFDGQSPSGRPIVNRPAVDPEEQELLAAYLRAGPVVLSARSYEADVFEPSAQDVPLNFRTDGTFVWAGAVPYYLEKYGIPPEVALVEHIRRRGFGIGEVDEEARQQAVQAITE